MSKFHYVVMAVSQIITRAQDCYEGLARECGELCIELIKKKRGENAFELGQYYNHMATLCQDDLTMQMEYLVKERDILNLYYPDEVASADKEAHEMCLKSGNGQPPPEFAPPERAAA